MNRLGVNQMYWDTSVLGMNWKSCKKGRDFGSCHGPWIIRELVINDLITT